MTSRRIELAQRGDVADGDASLTTPLLSARSAAGPDRTVGPLSAAPKPTRNRNNNFLVVVARRPSPITQCVDYRLRSSTCDPRRPRYADYERYTARENAH